MFKLYIPECDWKIYLLIYHKSKPNVGNNSIHGASTAGKRVGSEAFHRGTVDTGKIGISTSLSPGCYSTSTGAKGRGVIEITPTWYVPWMEMVKQMGGVSEIYNSYTW